MKKLTKHERDIAKQWAYGRLSLTEASRKVRRTTTGTYMVLARALKAEILERDSF